MAFDTTTRAKLAKLTAEARTLLTGEFTDQLQEIHGIQPGGELTDIGKLTHLDDEQRETAILLRDRISHLAGGDLKNKKAVKAAVERLIREQSFTVMNRFAALRMCEERGLIQECVAGGMQSKGFKVYLQIAGTALGGHYDRYRAFINCVFDEIAVDLGVLFDRFSLYGLLFPRETALNSLLELLNQPDLKPVWAEDETIGWIYQYFNSAEERRAMRKASQAPRNSRELAVRNQFFTPRYVVEFLTDNTLGRIWYEMTQGRTSLKDSCRYLVRRPNEIFLARGENAPPEPENGSDLSQEELLKQPVFIPYRPMKDPREIRMLDPACGSMHFGLYAFDLFETIYAEFYDLEHPPAPASGLKPLRKLYETREDFLRDVPRLIIAHNIHGVDIDPRAVQIAGLSLWLRAQRAWKNQGVRPDVRPKITKSNIVTAEPMPGDETMRREFIKNLNPPVLGQIVDVVFDRMKLAGEAGSLLKIEEEIKGAVAEARKQWQDGPKPVQQSLFGDEPLKQKQMELRFDLEGVGDEQFWEQAEDRILAALKNYAEQAENGFAVRRRLFADDAARGFAFIEICRKLYDVVLMNPPFGEPSQQSRKYIDNSYNAHKTEIMACFVSFGLSTLREKGMIGVISSRTVLINATCEPLRKEMGLGNNSVFAVSDLGYGVLDAAMVEASAYIAIKGNKNHLPIFLSLLKNADKEHSLKSAISGLNNGHVCPYTYLRDIKKLNIIFRFPWAYWLTNEVRNVFQNFKTLEDGFGRVRVGSSTADNWRFLRLSWEVPNDTISTSVEETFKGLKWVTLAKGGEYSAFYDDLHLLIDWGKNGQAVKEFKGSTIRSPEDYFVSGCTYPYRTTSAFSLRILPEGCIFADGGPAILAESSQLNDLWLLLSYFNTRIARYFMETFLGEGDAVVSGSAARNYIPRAVGSVPIPKMEDLKINYDVIYNWFLANAAPWAEDETSRIFIGIEIFGDNSIRDSILHGYSLRMSDLLCGINASYRIELNFAKALHLSKESMESIVESFGVHPCEFKNEQTDIQKVKDLFNLSIDNLVDFAAESCGHSRYISKKSYYVDRRIELISRITRIHPDTIVGIIKNHNLIPLDEITQKCINYLSYCLGAAIGRWDLRLVGRKISLVSNTNPFKRLPSCPPGMLISPNGLPAEPNQIVSEEWLKARPDANTLPPEGSVKNPTIPDSEYPIRISWNGVLVDDAGIEGTQSHPDDIVRRVREVLDVLWKDKAHEIEQEACGILGVPDLRAYFGKPSGFFQDHLKRYSKSRRKAPIYWPLSTQSGDYTLWIYYHRLTDQTLFTCVEDYINPKLEDLAGNIDHLQQGMDGGGDAKQRRRLEKLQDFKQELEDLKDELLRVAALPYKPDLNDGVLITACPLWKLFRLKSWQKDLKACWEKLAAGEYDWAHLACSIWPDRVKEKCRTDRSIAIAHDLEDLCEVEVKAKPKARK